MSDEDLDDTTEKKKRKKPESGAASQKAPRKALSLNASSKKSSDKSSKKSSDKKQTGKSMAKGVVFVERQVQVQKYINEHPHNNDKLIDIQRQKRYIWPVLLLLCNLRIRFQEPIEFPTNTHSTGPARNSLAWLITTEQGSEGRC